MSHNMKACELVKVVSDEVSISCILGDYFFIYTLFFMFIDLVNLLLQYVIGALFPCLSHSHANS